MTALSPASHDVVPKPVKTVAPYFVLILAVAAVYGNIFDNSFLFDDDLLIKINVYLRDWHHIKDILRGSTTSGAFIAGGFYRPVQMLLYLLAYQVGGGTPLPFHILNLTLHAADVCLVYRLGTKLGFHPGGVFLSALLWGIHPLHTEAVTYMSGTADPLFALFILSALIFLLPDLSIHKIYGSCPSFFLLS